MEGPTFSSTEPYGQFQPKLAQCLLFPRGDNHEIVKVHRRNLYIFFSRTAGPISTKFGTKHPWVEGIESCSNEESLNFHKLSNGFFLLLITIMIIICVNWFELFSQVSDVAHGPCVYNSFLSFHALILQYRVCIWLYLASILSCVNPIRFLGHLSLLTGMKLTN